MSKYYLKDHVTDEMLEAVGFRLVNDFQIYAIRTYDDGSHTFIDKLSKTFVFWNVQDIQDLIELGYVEYVEEMR